MFGSNGQQDIIINGSEVYGNVIAGNNAGDIHSNFVENTVRDRSISAGDTEFLGGYVRVSCGSWMVMGDPQVTMVVSTWSNFG